MRVIARFACFIARRASRGKGLLHDLGQLAQQHQLLADIQVQPPGSAVEQLQLPGQQGQAGLDRRQCLWLQAAAVAGWGQQLVKRGGVMGNFARAQAGGLPGEAGQGAVQAAAGVWIVVDQFQMLQAFLGLGQQYLGIQQEALQCVIER